MNREAVVEGNVRYAGFGVRMLSHFIDALIITLILIPALIYTVFSSGADVLGVLFSPELMTHLLINIAFTLLLAFIVLPFWRYKGATPGKMAFNIKIVDSKSFQPASTSQLIIRYFSYIISTLPLCLGFLCILWDTKKQGWHDKLAQTVVIRK